MRALAFFFACGVCTMFLARAPGWTRRVTAKTDLGELLAAAHVDAVDDVQSAARRHGGAELRTLEERRDRDQQARIAVLRRRFVDGPTVTLPRRGAGAMITTGAEAIPGVGTDS
jgi:hypothetical protein